MPVLHGKHWNILPEVQLACTYSKDLVGRQKNYFRLKGKHNDLPFDKHPDRTDYFFLDLVDTHADTASCSHSADCSRCVCSHTCYLAAIHTAPACRPRRLPFAVIAGAVNGYRDNKHDQTDLKYNFAHWKFPRRL